MRGAQRRTDEAKSPAVPPLVHGQRLTQEEFHRRYEAYPEDVKFELIGGIVHMASPQRLPHGRYHVKLSAALEHYACRTPGVELVDNSTSILGGASEPQPDLAVRIIAAYGGQSRETEAGYMEGPPELIAEVAHSTAAIDLGAKRNDYERAGVVEYLVLLVEHQELRWFDFPSGRELRPNRQQVWKSKVLPGLWINEKALMALDTLKLIHCVDKGLASAGYGQFVKRLVAAYRRLTQE